MENESINEGGQAAEESLKPLDKKPRGSSKGAAFLLGIVIVVVLAGLAVVGYGWMSVKKLSQDEFVLKIAKAFQFPVAKINGSSIPYVEYVDDIVVLKKFYSGAPEGAEQPTDEQISDQVLARLVANKLIASIAEKYDIIVTEEDLQKSADELIAQFSDRAAAEKEIMNRYGWTLDTYAQKVIYPILVEQKLSEKFSELDDDSVKEFKKEEVSASHILFKVDDKTDDAAAKKNAQAVLDRIKAGEDFVTLAAEFGSDGTKETGGSLGWFGRGMMVPEFEQAVFSLEPGQLSDDLVKTQFGYHIVRLDEKRNAADFIAFMDSELRKARIKVLVNAHNPFEVFSEEKSADDAKVSDETVSEANEDSNDNADVVQDAADTNAAAE